MNLLDPVDIYCERLAHGMWEEPLNTLSNVAFFVAAYLLYQRQRQHTTYATYQRQNHAIIALVVLVGIGSTIFHTFANTIGMIADILGIMLFVHAYLYLCLRRLLHWPRLKSLVFIIVLFVMLMLAENIPQKYSVNGSMAYAPCLAVIAWIWSKTRNQSVLYDSSYRIAGITFLISLIFRSLDMTVCVALPIGTHLLWHLCNGVVLYYLSKPLLLSKNSIN